ncbi:MAG: xanthine dehydrogenase family protein molybdopterin-binding subunit, partial [bacterium]
MTTRQALKVAGTSPARLDGVEKVTGRAVYTGDIELPGMAFAKILRSPLPHAKLVNIDAGKAERLPGVLAVLTRDDLAGLNYRYGAAYKDQCVVAVDKVRFVGDPVAAVLAVDEATAEQALALIDVEYEELPPVVSIEEAIAPGAPLVHEGETVKAELRGSDYSMPERFRGTNICYHFGYARGDVGAGFKGSAHVFEDTFRFSKVQHASLEPHVTVAHFEGEQLTV